MDTLYRYSLKKTPEYDCNRREHVIKLTKQNQLNFDLKGGIFFSLNGALDTYSAHSNLALTYYPAYRRKMNTNGKKFTLEDNRGGVISNELEDFSAIPRSWPSFGQPGGSREVILICDDSANIELIESPPELEDGGEVDEFHLEDSTIYDQVFAKLISAGLVSGLRESGVPITDVGETGSIGSYKPGSGVTVVSVILERKWFISVSVGWQQYGRIIRFRFWYTLFKDIAPIRYIYGPIGHTFDFLSCIGWDMRHCFPPPEVMQAFLIEQLEREDYPYKELKELAKSYINQLTKVTDGFFRAKSHHFILPPL